MNTDKKEERPCLSYPCSSVSIRGQIRFGSCGAVAQPDSSAPPNRGAHGKSARSGCQWLGLTLLLLPAILSAQTNDWKIVPGERVGPISRASTLATLQQRFRASNVREQTIVGAEGAELRGAIVYPDNPARRLAIVWGQGESTGHPEDVEICYKQESGGACEWKTAQGITLGTSLVQLERLNGHLFHLAGFGWDYGGMVLAWDGGRLEALQAGGLSLELLPDPKTIEQPDRLAAYKQVQGDHRFSSGHPAMRALNPRVSAIHCGFAR
jgi:hypothetical protein